ncbi:HAD family hydrolase [Rhodopirellula sp. MGV]|uniref:HAD family hydrolase n=1 Tax=Rhodopirellula sp. MGV TaxID=2023130 RepID=UPI000B97C7AC|nr:HAD family phosphatase [Rhodopirellula sp. MGV]OYP31671.1 hypothetical protein CGZ80_20905 [Rhodopirellula sp. MGV]PNY33968.1 HAD family phosphatase [Rhodopirellula baltica]
MSEIQFVYFDLGNILIAFDPKLASANLARITNVTEEKAWDALYASGLEDRYEHGELDGPEFAEQIRHALGVTQHVASDQVILDGISDMFTPIESMVEIVERTRRTVGRIGILSNTCEAHWDWIRRQSWGVSKLQFDVTVLSCRVGAMKPAAEIYASAADQADVPPASILFIDDKQENVDAARRHGWRAYRCLGGEEAGRTLENELNFD